MKDIDIFSASFDKFTQGDKMGSLVDDPDNQVRVNPNLWAPKKIQQPFQGEFKTGNISLTTDEGQISLPDTTEEQSFTSLAPLNEISLQSLPDEKISVVNYERMVDKEIQTVVSCAEPNVRLETEYTTNLVQIGKLIEKKQYEYGREFMTRLANEDWMLPAIDFNSLERLEKENWFYDSKNKKQQTKMQDMKAYRRQKGFLKWSEQEQNCAEIMLTLISIINFQQVTLEEIIKDNQELAGLIDKYDPQIKKFNELTKRIIKESSQQELRCINNLITQFSWEALYAEISHDNLQHWDIKDRFMSSEEYKNKIRRNLIKCKNYINGCYSKNMEKNRRIMNEMYRIFALIKEN